MQKKIPLEIPNNIPPLEGFDKFIDFDNENIKNHLEVIKLTNEMGYGFGTGSIPQYIRETPKVGRNEPCTCGSGKKHKQCCLNDKKE